MNGNLFWNRMVIALKLGLMRYEILKTAKFEGDIPAKTLKSALKLRLI